ncbi:hypothetical protein D3C71_693350 [compost metagenome]
MLVGNEFDEFVRAGADRLAGEDVVADFLHVFRRHDIGRITAHAGGQKRIGALGLDADGQRIDDFDAFDRADIGYGRRLCGRVNDAVDGELDRFGIHRLTVVEFHAVAQLEFPGRVVDRLPRGGKARDQLHLLVAHDKSVEDVVDDRGALLEEAGIHRGGRRAATYDDIGRRSDGRGDWQQHGCSERNGSKSFHGGLHFLWCWYLIS